MPTKKSLSNENIALNGILYARNKKAIAILNNECSKLRLELESYLDAAGKTLPSGSILAVISHADLDVHLKKTLRVGKTLLPEAIDVLRENGLEECIEMVPVVREDVLERLYEEEKIPGELLTRIYQDKSSYAFSVDLKHRMSDAPEE